MTGDEYMNSGRRLRAKRKELKWTQEYTAERLNISASYYAAIEGGDKPVSSAMLPKLSRVFGLSADYILFGKLDSHSVNGIMNMLNSLSEKRRQYAYRAIIDFLEALTLDE
ncbi:hypothetical protein FACS1894191_6440 [Clostridia bacterium]|nr:hypothetical protein FACS1894191_6440 [Clostridia bacterium]